MFFLNISVLASDMNEAIAGHVIKQSFIGDQNTAGHVGGTNTSFTDSGLEIAHVALVSSADSYLIWDCKYRCNNEDCIKFNLY